MVSLDVQHVSYLIQCGEVPKSLFGIPDPIMNKKNFPDGNYRQSMS